MAENKKHVINDENKYESVSILLSKEKYPIAFEKYVTDMMQGGMTREEAEKWLSQTPIELEIYYEKGAGLFGIEAEALESASNTICSPYSKESFED